MMKAFVTRAGVILVAGFCLLVPGSAAPRQGQQKVALVNVIADASGPLRDLTAKDFIVTEDNKKREVVAAELSQDPLSIVLLVDSTQPPMGTVPPTQDLRSSLATFVKVVQAHNPGAQIAMSEFAGAAVPRVAFSAKPGELEAAIGRLFPNQQQQAVLLEALVDAGKQMGEQPPPRRAIVAVDFNSQEGSAERTMKAAADAVTKAGATLWSVSVRGTGNPNPTANREEVLNKVIQNNGGLRLMPVDAAGLMPNLKIVAHSLSSQYTVTFMREGNNPKALKFDTTRGAKAQLTMWMR
jgi:hypothetical protein